MLSTIVVILFFSALLLIILTMLIAIFRGINNGTVSIGSYLNTRFDFSKEVWEFKNTKFLIILGFSLLFVSFILLFIYSKLR